MSEFYDPMLYLSTPEHPNTMGAQVVLKELSLLLREGRLPGQ